jgi:hypothetical protein
MPETPVLGLPTLVAEQAQKHVTHNEALRALDAIVQLSVKNRDLAAPPGAPAEGDRHVVADAATGAWSGHDGEVAVREDGSWAFHAPGAGWRAWIEEEGTLVIFDGVEWVEIGATIAELQSLALFGIGTIADATNPFAAKLNKALWTARTVAEGGDGDLRYTLNKEGAADVLSLLFQSGFSGRAEIGLVGDDDLAIKVSADGSAWIEALRLSGTDGGVRLKLEASDVASLPSAAARGAGALIHVTDEAGGAVVAFSDGTDWRRVTDRAVVS